MTSKIKIKLTFTFFLFLLIQGCLNYTQVTSLRTDGSGSMFVHYWSEINNPEDTLFINRIGIFNADSIRKEFSSEYLVLDEIEVYKDYRDSTIHAKVELTFAHFDSLNLSRAFRASKFSILDGPEETKIFSQFIMPFATGFGINREDFRVRYVYYLPGEIIEHNAMEKTRNKLTWEYNLEEIGSGKTISAVYRPFLLKETPKWIYILSLLVLLIVISFLLKKRKV